MVLSIRLCFLVIFVTALQSSQALYEDQIGKFDWRKRYIGKVFAHSKLDKKNSERILVATEENVIASLSLETGEIIWRQVLEKSPRGDFKFVKFRPQYTSVPAAIKHSSQEYDILTVTGSSPIVVRGWNGDTGNIVFEWSLVPSYDIKRVKCFWFYKDNTLYQVVEHSPYNIEIAQLYPTTGEIKREPKKLAIKWKYQESGECYVTGTYYICVDTINRKQLYAKDLSDSIPHIETTLAQPLTSSPKTLEGYDGVIIVENREIVVLRNNLGEYDPTKLKESLKLSLNSAYALLTKYAEDDVLITTSTENENLNIGYQYLSQSTSFNTQIMSVPLKKEYGKIDLLTLDCSRVRSSDVPACVALVGSRDGALQLFINGKLKWTREEALAKIAAVELIDLPLEGTESVFENEIQKSADHAKGYDIWGAFTRRMQSQWHLLKNAYLNLLPTRPQQQKKDLTRDAFGLHKMIVILTECGKIFGIDNISGEQHWAIYSPKFSNFKSQESMKIIVQRTSKHSPFQPLCTILAKDRETGNGIMMQINPIHGVLVNNGATVLNYKIKQIAVLRENEKDHTKGILVIDQNNGVHVIPENASKMAIGMFIFVAEKDSAIVTGYFVKQLEKLELVKIWAVDLAGRGPLQNAQERELSQAMRRNLMNEYTHSIVAIAAKNSNEHVHSQGRVLGDRSVLYKYLNPNLLAIITAPTRGVNRDMNVHLLDAVSGALIYSMTHRRVRGPVKAVHSENWLVYSYFSEKARRTEITTVELYAANMVRSNSTIWTSLENPVYPRVEKQSFIMPVSVEAMQETITERGITNKHVLFGLPSGGIAEISWALLDPLRPSPNQVREEGSIPYIPELVIPSETVINYNQTIARLREIYTAPSGLESTCLVVAYGLDLFITRVSPSKTFDLLKEDFDYMLISFVLIGLLLVSSIVQYLSSRKALKQAWK